MVTYWDRFIERYGREVYVKYRYMHESYPCLDPLCEPCEAGVQRLIQAVSA